MRVPWTPARFVAVATGGVAGAAVRWAVLAATSGAGRFPWPLLAVNAGGSFLLGALLAGEVRTHRARVALHDFGAIGFCGGLTTFSTFAVEGAGLVRDGDVTTAIAYTIASVLAALAGVVAGAALLRRVSAVRLPLEESL